jgi:NADPH-dependent curcumin reductase CurA
MANNLCVRFVKTAAGAIDASHFAVATEAIPSAESGDIVVQNAFVSLDPYQRRQMMPNVAYANPLNLGDVMVGRAIGQVVESTHADFQVGDWALGHFGWQRYTKIKASGAEKINLDGFSASTYLGALGSPGVTAWVGLRAIAKAVPTDTVVISAATGAVGSVAAALARSIGCRVVGIAGGPVKDRKSVV